MDAYFKGDHLGSMISDEKTNGRSTDGKGWMPSDGNNSRETGETVIFGIEKRWFKS